MKKIIFTLAATAFITGILLTSCNSPSQKIKNAGDKVQDAKEAVTDAESNMNLARQDSITEFQQFKTEYQNQISANEKSIAGLKLSFEDVSPENKVLYEKKLAEFAEKNSEMSIKLAAYKEGETGQGQTFQSEFKRDMDELGKAFSDFTVSDKK